MMIPYGYSVTLYSDDGFKGDTYTVQAPFYEDSNFMQTCVSLYDGNFNDRTSSLEVFKTH